MVSRSLGCENKRIDVLYVNFNYAVDLGIDYISRRALLSVI